ncbi:hypothetical protein [Chitinophaga arvensicola]|uniref:Uncharacterized protein n=1 Tax=Chitinophaga arvensicola TaxID=29529 RepID=A0A1I0S6G0_9BACT|nr:hypothetical protein [Chitinophaga arvensicola]SEW50774.1 hypothetical protein SAMN04488122_3953 [Chitinophaga arvensicola]
MKKFGIIVAAAAMLFMSASSFAQTPAPKKEASKTEAPAKAPAHKAHSKHHHAAKPAAAPAAPKAK